MQQEHMNEDEQFARITLEYVTACEEGRRPQLREYIQRYPQYADALGDFASYYHGIEAPLVFALPNRDFTADEQQGIEQLIRKVSSRVASTRKEMQPLPITSLLKTAENQKLRVEQLATTLKLSQEIVEQLEQHEIEAGSIPQAVSRQLALILLTPVSAIQRYLESDGRHAIPSPPDKSPRVAETRPLYPAGEKMDFLQAIEESATMTEQQKRFWRETVAQERQKR